MTGRIGVAFALAYLAAAGQWAWEARHPRLGPDLPVLAAILAGLSLPRPWATAVGWTAGLLHGLAAAQNAALYAGLGAVVAFALASFDRLRDEEAPPVVFVTVALATLAIGGVRTLLAPGEALGRDAVALLVAAGTNGLSALPLRRIVARRDRG